MSELVPSDDMSASSDTKADWTQCECTCGLNAEPICEHTFDGWQEWEDADCEPAGGCTACSKCGLTRLAHDISIACSELGHEGDGP